MMLGLSLAWAGAWVPEPGGTYLKAELAGFEGAQRDLGVALYGEAGVLPGVAVLGRLPWQASTREGPGYDYRRTAFGDVQAGAAVRVPFGVTAASLVARIPAWRDLDDSRFGALTDRFPRPGDGQVDLDAKVETGVSTPLGGGYGWGQAGLGWRFRFEAPADSLLVRAQAGWTLPGTPRPSLRWVAVDAEGVTPLVATETTRRGLSLGGVTAVGLARGLDLELRLAGMPLGTDRGWGGSVGLAWTREGRSGR